MANFFDYEQAQDIKKNNDNFFDFEEQKGKPVAKNTSFFDYQTQKTKPTNKPVTTNVKHSKPDKSKIKYLPNGEVDTEHYKANIDEIAGIPQVDMPVMGHIVDSEGKVLSGGISKDVRYYNERFPDRKNKLSYDIEKLKEKENKNIGDIAKIGASALWNIPTGFISNAAKDTGDTIKGLAQLVGQGMNKIYFTPINRMVKGQAPVTEENVENLKNFAQSNINSLTSLPKIFQRDEQGRNKYRLQYRQDHPEIAAMKDALVQGLKENYGQKDIDIISENGINFDPVGFAQSYYAHPLNLLDVVGLGEVGKLKPIAQLSKGGQASNLAKTVGNKTIRPKYSENLVLNAGERLLESEPVQNIVNMVDESPVRPVSDLAADFLGLNPDSRLLGTKGAEVRLAKQIEQANQVKNITERNAAIAENQALLSGLDDVEAKELVKGIESGNAPMYIEGERAYDVRNALRDKAAQNAEFYTSRGLLAEETVKELPINTYASIKYNKPIDSLSDVEKLEALKDIEKMPLEQQPFYVPMMYDDKLRASDFFANSTKRYKPSELKHRSVGMGLETNRTGGKRVYDPVELANRLDAHRIKMVNTEKMINELIDNFAKPLDLSKDKVLDGYVPFNPDAFMKFYKKSIDLNEAALSKIADLDNVDDVIKASIQQAIQELPDDIIEVMGAFKNNKIYQIPKNVAETLMAGKNKKGIWEMMFDMGTAGFKRKVLGLSPKWFINNRIGNGIMAGLKGVLPEHYIKAFNVSEDLLPESLRTKSMYEAEKTIIGRTGGGNNSTFGNVTRLLGGEFIDTSELKGIKKAQVTAANALGVPGKVINTLTDAMFAFNQKFETLERKAAYLHSVDAVGKKMLKTTGQNIVKQDELLKNVLDNPEVLDAVLKDVDNTLGDYINMTAVERRVIRKAVPFYSWLRTITRYTLSLPESNPFRASMAEKVNRVLREENEDLPEFQKGATRTEFKADVTGKPLVLNYEHSIPFSTFADTADNPIGLINPMITRPIEAITGHRFFMNKPLVSPNYQNQFGGGYGNLNPMYEGEFSKDLPIGERLKALPLDYIRTTVPAFDAVERVGIGSLMNLYNGNGLRPYDALYDTGFGGYNYNEGFYKNPKGWSNTEQVMRMFFPLQQESQEYGNVKLKRKVRD